MRSAMKAYCNGINRLSEVTKWVSMGTMFVMMIYITVTVIARKIGKPMVGNVELVELGLILVFQFAIPYSQMRDAHLAIGILVDKFPKPVQYVLEIVGYFLTIAFSTFVCGTYIRDAVSDLVVRVVKTQTLMIAKWPFKFFIALGMLLWALSALAKLIISAYKLSGKPLELGDEFEEEGGAVID